MKNINRFVLSLGLLVSCSFSVSAQTLTLLTEDAFPFQYVEKEKLVGMAVDVVNEMFKRAGVAHKDELLSWDKAYDRAQMYPNTCIYSTARTENRENSFKWIGPIVENKWAAFAKKGFAGVIKGPDDFSKYRIGVLKNDAKDRFLKDLAIPFRVQANDDSTNPPKLSLSRTEADKIDLWITGYYTGPHIAAKVGVKDIVPVLVFQTSPNYLACRSNIANQTLDKLQHALDAMKRDGSYNAIVGKYETLVKAR